MATMLQHKEFMRRFGIVQPGQLVRPRIFSSAVMALPRDSILHYVGENLVEYGPSSDDQLLANITRLVFIDHVRELTSFQGNPRQASTQPDPLIQSYHRRYRKVRRLNRIDIATREDKNLLVNNYALLPHLYKYVRSFFTMYYTWSNIQATMWSKANERMADTTRQQFVRIRLPDSLPSLQQLRLAESRQTRDTLEAFNTPEKLAVLDLWAWVGEQRGNSHINRLDAKYLDRVNFMIMHKDHWFVLNLGRLETWRKTESNNKGLPPSTLQLRVLKLLEYLIETNSQIGVTEVKPVITNIDDTVEVEDEETVGTGEIEKQLDDLAEFDQDEIKDLEVLHKDLDELLENIPQEDTTVFDEDGNVIEEAPVPEVANINNTVKLGAVRTLDGAIKAKADALADRGVITGADYRRLYKISEAYKSLKDPYGSNKSLEETLVIHHEDLVLPPEITIPDSPEIMDKSMLESTVTNYDKLYTANLMKKDITAAVLSVQHAGVAVVGYDVERVVNAVSDFEIHTVQLQPAVGRSSTIRFRLPRVKEDGTFVSNGTRYRLRKQRSEVPIVKVSPTRVALTSYYSKLFVEKSDRSVFNYDKWISGRVVATALDKANTDISDIKISSVEDNNVKTPAIYSIMATRCASFTVWRDNWRDELPDNELWSDLVRSDDRRLPIMFNFDVHGRFKSPLFPQDAVESLERSGKYIVTGRVGDDYVVVDYNDVFYINRQGTLHVLGRLEDVIGLDVERAPVPMAELKIFSKSIPIGIVLAYMVGLTPLIKALRLNPRRVPNGQRLNMMPDEYAVRFLDESLIFQKDDVKAALVFSGFNLYHNVIRNYGVHLFDKRDVYLNVLDANGIGIRYLRELDMMNAMWIDPITKSLLEEMGEPTEFIDLLLRATEMLATRYVPTKIENPKANFDGLERARGYERFAGVVYSKLVESIRTFNTKTAVSKAAISMNPHDVWVEITQDPAAELVNDISPIHNVKEKEVITFGGRGGRSQRSMVAEHRLYKESDLGFISEATVDSGQVAIITYLPPNAKFTSLRGTVKRFDKERDGSSAMLSSAALISPAADRDDPKRVNAINIQQTHVIATKGYRPAPLRTGYEQVLAHRVDDTFAKVAEMDGKVVDLSDDHLTVEYTDGTKVAIETGKRFGVSAGSVYPNEIKTTFKVGEQVKKGDVLAYNEGFFEPTLFNKRQVTWKAGVIARTAILEAGFTLEDSSAITPRLAELLTTRTTKVKTIIVKFDQSIRDLVKAGDKVDLDTILCSIEDSVTANNKLFDEDSLSSLRLLSAMTPRAKVVGTVEKIEVYYHGDIEDMSESLQELATAGDRDRKRKCRKLGTPVVTGSVDQSLRIDGSGLDLGCVAIQVYITSDVGTGIGDKAVFGNQMKTVIGRVLEGVHETESGKPFDAIFGAKSIQDRIVWSPMVIGTTNTLMRVICEKASDVYFAKK